MPPPSVVGGRLSGFFHVWKKLGASDFVVRVLRWGYRPSFRESPTLSSVPILPTSYRDPVKHQAVGREIFAMLEKGALEEVFGDPGLGFYSRLFLVPKKNGKLRPIIDLRRLNRMLVIPRFQMETIQSVWDALIPGNFSFSLDLSDAYFHIPIRKDFRKYLRIFFDGRVFQFKALPFGLSTSPWIFTKVMSEVKQMVHLQNILLMMYLDDWLVQVASFLLGLSQVRFMLDLCSQLGLLVNQEKSELIPTQNFVFIGARFDLIQCMVYPKSENSRNLRLVVMEFLRATALPARTWQALLGTLGSQDRFVRFARLHMRPLQWFLAQHWNQLRDSQDALIPIPKLIKDQLRWWLVPGRMEEGVPLLPPDFQVRAFTDASTKGWGAQVDNSLYQGEWSAAEALLHINVLEMRAVIRALQAHCPPPRTRILVATDNTTVVAYINKEGGTRSWNLMLETLRLFGLIIRYDWTVKARYIPGRLNVIADQLSRSGQVLPSEWSLSHHVVQWLFSRWGTPHVDLFATRHNKKCPVFVSPAPDPLAWEVDALSLSLEGLSAYAYPPHQILLRFLQRFQMSKVCRVIVVAPFWPKQPWFPLLNQLSLEPPLQLPQSRHLLKQPLSNVFHQDVRVLNLHAWLLERNL